MSRPLHERIRTEIERRILAGALAPGERLPTEGDFMAAYGCSRMTVSKALSALAVAGLVERRRRAGTFVARPRVHAMVLDVPDLAAEITARGQVYAYRLLDRRDRAPADREEARLARGGGLLALRGLHLADAIPLALEHRVVAIAEAPGIVDADFAEEAPGSWLLRHVPWTEAESRIAAVAADDETARLLAVELGCPCLRLDRETWREAAGVTITRQLFVGAAYDLVARFGPRAAG